MGFTKFSAVLISIAFVLCMANAFMFSEEDVPAKEILEEELNQKKIGVRTDDTADEFTEIAEELRGNRLGNPKEFEEIEKMEEVLKGLSKNEMKLVISLLKQARSSKELREAVKRLKNASEKQEDILKELRGLLRKSSQEQSFTSLLRILEHIIEGQNDLNTRSLEIMRSFFGKPVSSLADAERKLLNLLGNDQASLSEELEEFSRILDKSAETAEKFMDPRGVNLIKARDALSNFGTIADMDTAKTQITQNRANDTVVKQKEIIKELEAVKKLLTETELNPLEQMEDFIKRLEEIIRRQKGSIQRTKIINTDSPIEDVREAYKEEKEIERLTTELKDELEMGIARTNLGMAEIEMRQGSKKIETREVDVSLQHQNKALEYLLKALEALKEELEQLEEEMEEQTDLMDELMEKAERLENLLEEEKELKKETEKAEEENLDDMAEEQEAVREETEQLKEELEEIGSDSYQELDKAEEDMQDAEQQLDQNNQDEGTQDQQEAIDDMEKAQETLESEMKELDELMQRMNEEIEDMMEQQEDMMEQTSELDEQQQFEQMEQRQENLREKLEQLRKEMEKAEMEQTAEEMQQAEEHMEQAEHELNEEDKMEAQHHQQQALEEMAKMQQRMKQQQQQRQQMQKEHDKSEEQEQTAGGTIKKGQTKEEIAEKGWDVSLPPKARDKLTQALENDFPERYEELLELYYKNLSQKEE